MDEGKPVKDVILQSYVIEILRELKLPKRFNDIQKNVDITNQTLSVKLLKLKEYGLVRVTPSLEDGKYVNKYALTEKGRRILGHLDAIR